MSTTAFREGTVVVIERKTYTLLRKVEDVICQGSCHVTQAAFFTVLSSWRIGLSQTVSGRSQFRVAPRQRSG